MAIQRRMIVCANPLNGDIWQAVEGARRE